MSINDGTFILQSCFTFLCGYYVNQLDLNLFTWFGWLGCSDFMWRYFCQWVFFSVYLCVICRYVDIFQHLEIHCNFSKLWNQILLVGVFHLNLCRIDQVHYFFLARSRIYDWCVWNMLRIFFFPFFFMNTYIFAQNRSWVYFCRMVRR